MFVVKLVLVMQGPAGVERAKQSKLPGAGDRDRTGDIQLGKLTFPLASFSITLRIRNLSRNPFIINMMQELNRVHTLHRLNILSCISVNSGQYGQ